ncbi:HD-GYP domain-containing protein [Alicyclobacillus sp.]|uniref:HD-GYP domain-containing protein n=1 Tax=Alicyclobacillus sp. TaxID=61169 RepID=UPI0025B988FE|nr:HD-GYP domain-containing protein [Alicyclobacillus sp.]
MSLRVIEPNRVLARNILDERGRVLLARGITLTPHWVQRLLSLGITSVCIEDERTDDVCPAELITPETRQRVLAATYDTLTELVSVPTSRRVRSTRVRGRMRPLVEEIIEEMRELGHAGQQFGNVYLTDGELYHHSVNVTLYALALGIALRLSTEQLIHLGLGALLHDVGKLRIPRPILKKPGRLTEDEYQTVKLHTVYGYEILRDAGELPSVSNVIALQHHERMDGSGYPAGIGGTEIHLFGRVTAVADVYEALTANRVYRAGYLPHDAYEMLLAGSGSLFDPRVIDAFVRTVDVYPVGMTVRLSNGCKGVVVRTSRRQSQRPVVRLLETESGQPVQPPVEVDLAKELTLAITGCEV